MVQNIEPFNLLFVLALVFVVAAVYRRWSLGTKIIFYATARMLAQLVLIGFALTYIFSQKNPLITCALLAFMVVTASWIAVRPLKSLRASHFPKSLIAVSAGSIPTLALVIGGVIRLEPWHEARYLIPIAGMIFANSMNSVSLAADRFLSETQNGAPFQEARKTALQTALLPITNNLLAVGLVALPGMMTGQILSGVHPLIAVRYQIMVMCMLFGAGAISAAVYLTLCRHK